MSALIANACFIMSAALVVVVGLMAAVTVIRLLDGTILMRGLLWPTPGERSVQPDRLILLGITLFAGFAYFAYGLASGAPDGIMPDIPGDLRPDLLTAFGGSHAFYLFRKFTFVRGGR